MTKPAAGKGVAASTSRASSADPASDTETPERKPELVGPPRYSPRDKCMVHPAVDHLGQRLHIGDHVCVNNGGAKHWVAVVEAFFHCPNRKAPAFRGRWFWDPDDVRGYQESSGRGESMRPSRALSHELICSDTRDTNLVEVIAARAHVLSWPNFQLVRARVNRARARWRTVYFCDRLYYHKAFVLRDISPVLFPGDPIPPELLEEISLCPDDVGRASDCMRKTPYLIGSGPAKQEQAEGEDMDAVEVSNTTQSEHDKPLDPNAVFIV